MTRYCNLHRRKVYIRKLEEKSLYDKDTTATYSMWWPWPPNQLMQSNKWETDNNEM